MIFFQNRAALVRSVCCLCVCVLCVCELCLFVRCVFVYCVCLCVMCLSVVCVVCVCAPRHLRTSAQYVSHFTCQVCSTGWARPAPLAGRGWGRSLGASSWLVCGRLCTARSARRSALPAAPRATCSSHILHAHSGGGVDVFYAAVRIYCSSQWDCRLIKGDKLIHQVWVWLAVTSRLLTSQVGVST